MVQKVKIKGCGVMGVCLVVATAVIAGRAEAQPGVGVGEQRLAHRFNQWAQELMSQGYGDEQDRVEAALTLLEAASQLDGANAEIHRLTIEAMQMSGRREGLNKTLGAYLRLVPTDDVAQLKLIGLLVDGADTVEARLLIYERLLNGRGAQSLSAALRSRVALGAALYHRETGDLKQYGQYLKQAVTLDESNPDAAFEAYLFLEERGVGRVQRANALLNVLAAAPTRSDLHIRLARLLMECGLYDAAANWFDSASWLWATEGYPDEIAMGLIVNEWALSVWGAGQPQAALNLIESFRAAGANGDDAEVLAVDLQLTQLAILSAVGRDDDVAVLFEALLKSLRPTDAATALSVESMAQHAWAYLLFDREVTQAAQWVGLVNERLEEGDALRKRLNGWLNLRQGQLDEAMATFEGASEQDAAARFGLSLVKGDGAGDDSSEKWIARWSKVNQLDPQGLLGVWAMDYISQKRGRLVLEEESRTVGRLVEQVPAAIRDIAIGRNGLVMFRVRNDVRAVGFAEPIEVEYELMNVSSIPLSLGPGAAIPTRVFGAPSLHHAGRKVADVNPLVIDMYRRLRLEPGEALRFSIEIDGGALGQALTDHAGEDLLVRMVNVYHPRVSGAGEYVPGLLGSQKPINAVIWRSGDLSEKSVMEQIRRANGQGVRGPEDKYSALAWLATVVGKLRNTEAGLAKKVVGVLTQAYAQGDGVLQAWMLGYLEISGDPSDPLAPVLDQAMRSESVWVQMALLSEHVNSVDSPVLLAALQQENQLITGFAKKIRDIIEKK